MEAWGLSWIVLSAALIGCGCYRTGLLLLGLAPAVHPSLGIWLALITALALAFDRQIVRTRILPNWRWFAVGAAVTAASLLLHLWTSRGVAAIGIERPPRAICRPSRRSGTSIGSRWVSTTRESR